MEYLAFALIVLVIYSIINTKNQLKSLNEGLYKFQEHQFELQKKMDQVIQKLDESSLPVAADSTASAEEIAEPPVLQTPEVDIPPPIPQDITESISEPELVLPALPQEPEEVTERYEVGSLVNTNPEPTDMFVPNEVSYSVSPVEEQEPALSWFERFKQNNPDLEKFIGENLINKIGILILVLGISFFVKFAIDRDWINEAGRVGIGIFSGGLLMGVAHFLRRKFAAFSSVFVAGAVSVFYLTIGIAFHDYHLFSQPLAFGIMVLITIFSIFISLLYDRQELAILSIIGGFGVPFMVSTGQGNYHVLFTYLSILNIGMLSVSYFKRWNWVNFVAFVATFMIYAGWYFQTDFAKEATYAGAFGYLTLFFLIFSLAFIINNVRFKNKFTKWELIIILANTFLYFSFGLAILSVWNSEYKGLFSLILAVYNLIFAVTIYRKYRLSEEIVYLLIGLTLLFAVVTIPIQFKGNYITAFWACEAVILLWLAKKSKFTIYYAFGIILQVLVIFSLFIDWTIDYVSSDTVMRIGLNEIFLTGILVVASYYVSYRLFKQSDEVERLSFNVNFNPVDYRKIVAGVAIALSYVVLILEVSYQASNRMSNDGSVIACIALTHFVFATVLVYYGTRSDTPVLPRILCYALVILNIAAYLVFVHRIPFIETLNRLNKVEGRYLAFFLHYPILICLIFQLYRMVKDTILNVASTYFRHKLLVWPLVFVLVFICSVELSVHTLAFAETFDIYHSRENMVFKVMFPVAWGILSFVFLILGIKQDWRMLRIAALSLLGVTILKLFVYDIKDVSETGKIIAFILLGVLILVISFVYQRIKKLIVVDNKELPHEENS